MRKICTFFMLALMCAVVTNAKTVYLNTGGSSLWGADSPVFFAHSWSSEADNADAQMTLVSGDVYSAEINDGHGNVLFVRMPSGSTSVNWDGLWNKTSDQVIPTDKNLFTITAWGNNKISDGNWSTYSGGGGQGGDAGVWYYKGNIDGKDVEPSDATKFEKGVVEFACSQKSYLFIIYQEAGKPGVQYMTDAYVDGGDNCVLKNTASADKWGVAPYAGNLYLYYGDDATQVILSKVEIPGRVLVDSNTALSSMNAEGKKAIKLMKDGRLFIQQGDKLVDVLGRAQ